MTDETLITTATVAERLGVSPRTVTRYVNAGKLQVARRIPGGRGVLLFDEAHIALFEDQRRIEEAPIYARALREAADAWLSHDPHNDPEVVAHWLRERADRLEAEANE